MTSLTREQKAIKQQDEIAELRAQQIAQANGEEDIALVDANLSKKHKIRAAEKDGYVHVATRIKHLNANQKDFTYEDRIIPIHAREFDRKVAEGAFNLFDECEVIHDPRKGRPVEYDLQPGKQPEQKDDGLPRTPIKNENIAAREKQLAKRESMLDDKFDQIEEQAKALEEKQKAIDEKLAELADMQAKAEQAKALEVEAANKKASEGPTIGPTETSGPTITSGPNKF